MKEEFEGSVHFHFALTKGDTRTMRFNHIAQVGRLAVDPERKTSPSGTERVQFRILVDQGDDEPPMPFGVTAFRGLDFIEEHVQKGDEVLVSGRLRYRTYQDGNDVQRVIYEITADTVQLASKSKKNLEAAAEMVDSAYQGAEAKNGAAAGKGKQKVAAAAVADDSDPFADE